MASFSTEAIPPMARSGHCYRPRQDVVIILPKYFNLPLEVAVVPGSKAQQIPEASPSQIDLDQ